MTDTIERPETITIATAGDQPPIVGIWDDKPDDLFTRYRVELHFTGWVIGSIPQDPKMMEDWLRKVIFGGDEALRRKVLETWEEIGNTLPAEGTEEELLKAIKLVANQRGGNTFRRDKHGIYLAAYQFKAALKEAANILYPWDASAGAWNKRKTKDGGEAGGKSARSCVAEWLFLDTDRIYLMRDGEHITKPDGTHMQPGNVSGPRGDRAIVVFADYVDRAAASFHVSSLHDRVTPAQWEALLRYCQRNGIGAMRKLDHGQFKVAAFEKV